MKLEKNDIIIITLISVIFFSVTSWNLGLKRTPITYWSTKKATVSITFDTVRFVNSLYFLVSSEDSIRVNISAWESGEWINLGLLNNSGYYQWFNFEVKTTTDKIELNFDNNAGDVYEIIAIDELNNRINFTQIQSPNSNDQNISNLIDEQKYFENPPTFQSETYFDEIYYVRTAQEYLSLREPTEWTHPPLGKLIIAAGIQLFSFSPFGWRLPGVIFSTLMIPIIYIFGLMMFKTRFAATLSAYLIAFDFMHFTMGRISTIDTYLVYFMLVSSFFFYLNFETMHMKSKPNFKFIFLGILFFYLAFSVKWTAVYGLIGQLILILSAAFTGSLGSMKDLITTFKSFLKPLLVILSFLLVGSSVYFATFIPYTMIGHDLKDIYNVQWAMFSYHSELKATHPFSSDWWSWPAIMKPLWLYNKQLPLGEVSTITAMGNPMIWWFGLPIILLALWRGIKNKEWSLLFIGVIYMFQWFPYAFISRSLFIYHYYPNVPILALATAGIMSRSWTNPNEKKYVITFIVAVAAFFVIFYPVISGFPIPIWYKEHLRLFGGWVF